MIKFINTGIYLLLLLLSIYCINSFAQSNPTLCSNYISPPGASIILENSVEQSDPMGVTSTCDTNDPAIGKPRFDATKNSECINNNLNGSYYEVILSRKISPTSSGVNFCNTSTRKFCDLSLPPRQFNPDAGCPITRICGNGALDSGEQCDLGFLNNNGHFGCDQKCQVVENWKCVTSGDEIKSSTTTMIKLYPRLCSANTTTPYVNLSLCPEKTNPTASDKDAHAKCLLEAYKRDLVTLMAVNIQNPLTCDSCASLLLDYTSPADPKTNPTFKLNCTPIQSDRASAAEQPAP